MWKSAPKRILLYERLTLLTFISSTLPQKLKIVSNRDTEVKNVGVATVYELVEVSGANGGFNIVAKLISLGGIKIQNCVLAFAYQCVRFSQQ